MRKAKAYQVQIDLDGHWTACPTVFRRKRDAEADALRAERIQKTDARVITIA